VENQWLSWVDGGLTRILIYGLLVLVLPRVFWEVLARLQGPPDVVSVSVSVEAGVETLSALACHLLC